MGRFKTKLKDFKRVFKTNSEFKDEELNICDHFDIGNLYLGNIISFCFNFLSPLLCFFTDKALNYN